MAELLIRSSQSWIQGDEKTDLAAAWCTMHILKQA
jgi:hypothetical protein